MNAFETEKIDGLLRGYFQSAMPRPWPAFAYPKAARTTRPRRTAFRLALAACVALLFLGYWTLAQMFPDPAVSAPAGIHQERHLGSRVKPGPDTEKKAPEGAGKLEKIDIPGGRF
ncbi:MAG: hypothetical protein U0793_13895 [Gemmataceae bacterium]